MDKLELARLEFAAMLASVVMGNSILPIAWREDALKKIGEFTAGTHLEGATLKKVAAFKPVLVEDKNLTSLSTATAKIHASTVAKKILRLYDRLGTINVTTPIASAVSFHISEWNGDLGNLIQGTSLAGQTLQEIAAYVEDPGSGAPKTPWSALREKLGLVKGGPWISGNGLAAIPRPPGEAVPRLQAREEAARIVDLDEKIHDLASFGANYGEFLHELQLSGSVLEDLVKGTAMECMTAKEVLEYTGSPADKPKGAGTSTKNPAGSPAIPMVSPLGAEISDDLPASRMIAKAAGDAGFFVHQASVVGSLGAVSLRVSGHMRGTPEAFHEAVQRMSDNFLSRGWVMVHFDGKGGGVNCVAQVIRMEAAYRLSRMEAAHRPAPAGEARLEARVRNIFQWEDGA